eukprot:SAG25_NODE_6317_length_569_cov_1.293617_1_plen_80_part_00
MVSIGGDTSLFCLASEVAGLLAPRSNPVRGEWPSFMCGRVLTGVCLGSVCSCHEIWSRGRAADAGGARRRGSAWRVPLN